MNIEDCKKASKSALLRSIFIHRTRFFIALVIAVIAYSCYDRYNFMKKMKYGKILFALLIFFIVVFFIELISNMMISDEELLKLTRKCELWINDPKNKGKKLNFDEVVSYMSSDLLDKVNQTIADTGSFAQDTIGLGTGAVSNVVGLGMNAVSGVTNVGSDAISGTVGYGTDFIKNTTGQGTNFIKDTTSNTRTFVDNTFDIGANAISGSVQDLGGFASNTVNDGTNFIGNATGNFTDFAKGTVNMGADFIGGTFGDLADFTKDTVKGGSNFVSNVFDRGTNFITGTVDNTANLGKNVVRSGTGAIDNVVGVGADSLYGAVDYGTDFVKDSVGMGMNVVKGTVGTGSHFVKGATNYGANLINTTVGVENFQGSMGGENIQPLADSYEMGSFDQIDIRPRRMRRRDPSSPGCPMASMMMTEGFENPGEKSVVKVDFRGVQNAENDNMGACMMGKDRCFPLCSGVGPNNGNVCNLVAPVPGPQWQVQGANAVQSRLTQGNYVPSNCPL